MNAKVNLSSKQPCLFAADAAALSHVLSNFA